MAYMGCSVFLATAVMALFLSIEMPMTSATVQRSGYFVHLNGLVPVLRYTGGHPDFAGTRPARGAKLRTTSAHVQAYADHLRAEHATVMARAGLAPSQKLYSYVYTLNAFAAVLSKAEVARLERLADVAFIRPDRVVKKATTHTPDFLRLPTTAWKTEGTYAKAGEGVIIGMIDTGINPEHPAFSAKTEVYGPPPATWYGSCKGHNFTCSNKLIGADWFSAGFTAGIPIDLTIDELSPRDHDGHGSHTASTAGGNHGYGVYFGTSSYGLASGMAPRARISAYKVIWASVALPGQPAASSGSTIDIVAAIDVATADGCDILSYSIGGALGQDFFSANAQAFLTAALNGVVVSTSAGNNGPTPSTVENAGPWLLSVAACTHDRVQSSLAHLGNKVVLSTGVGIFSGPATAALPLINGSDAALSGQTDNALLCYPGSLDPAKAKGKIVVCLRGGNGRVDKGLRVFQAGGAGMILVNQLASGSSTVEDLHYLPASNVAYSDGFPLAAYLASTKTPNASIVPIRPGTVNNEAPGVVAFSSRGPLDTTPSLLLGDWGVPDRYSRNYYLTPDVCAPGVNVWAAWCTTGGGLDDARPLTYNLISGTSMACPHVSGVAALLRQSYPTWSPWAIRSAIQTTAYQVDNKGKAIAGFAGPATAFDMGAGHLNPPAVLDPGLVFDSSADEMYEFLYGLNPSEAVGLQITAPNIPSISPWNLNVAPISLPIIAGTAIMVHRSLTSVYTKKATYRPTVVSPAGTKLTVTPASFTIAPGAVAKFNVLVTVTKHVVGWSFGSVTWKDQFGHSVRSVVAVNPSGT